MNNVDDLYSMIQSWSKVQDQWTFRTYGKTEVQFPGCHPVMVSSLEEYMKAWNIGATESKGSK